MITQATTPVKADSSKSVVQRFNECGLKVTPLPTPGYGDRNFVCAEHDGVPYGMNPREDLSDANIRHKILRRSFVIERHHAMVKGIYEFCLHARIPDVSVMVGGGLQLQVFFGQPNLYLGILYLTMESPKEDASPDDLNVVDNETFTLVLERKTFSKQFKELRVPGVAVTEFGSSKRINKVMT